MKKTLLIGFLAISFIYASQGFAETDYAAIARDNIAALDANREKWAYRIALTESGSTRIIEYDPSLEEPIERWLLISVDGEPPTEQQLKKHREEWIAGQTDDEEEDPLADFVNLDSLVYQDETENHYIVSFQPNISDLKDESKKLSGKMFIDKEKQTLDFLSVTNERNLNPAFSVSIKKFNLRLDFDEIEGALLPVEVTADVAGSALFLKSFEERSVEKYSDFRYVGEN